MANPLSPDVQLPEAPQGRGGPRACAWRRQYPVNGDPGLTPARQRAARFTAMAHCLEHDVEEPKPATTHEVEEPTPSGTPLPDLEVEGPTPANIP